MSHTWIPIMYVLAFASVVSFGYSLIMGNPEQLGLSGALLVGAGVTLVLEILERKASGEQS